MIEDIADSAGSRTCRPPMPHARTGGSSCIAQAALSRLWTCCSMLKSPESQTKYYQLRNWYTISVQFGLPGRCQRGAAR